MHKLTFILLTIILVLGTVAINPSSIYALGTGSISGTTFLDATCNGYDLSDRPLAGVSAQLKSKIIPQPPKAKSDANGNFIFDSLPFGAYTLVVSAGKMYRPESITTSYEIGEANGAVSGTFVFCRK